MVDSTNLGERVAVLETENDQLKLDIADIKTKLDSLLELKSKGLGALGLVGILIGSGVLGLIAVVVQFFSNKGHL